MRRLLGLESKEKLPPPNEVSDVTDASHDGKYRLVSGLVLAGDSKVKSSITEYLANVKEKRAIAKVVYRNVVSPSSL